MNKSWILGGLAAVSATSGAHAQSGGFQTPGMPGYAVPGTVNPAFDLAQASRFSSEFNPAFGIAIDLLADYVDLDAGVDGFDLSLRVGEVSANAWIDPRAWAYVVLTSDGEAPDLEEAAISYVGLGSRTTLRAGRFFIDFGKQMQAHVHDLRTIDRPAVLRAYLGEEVRGDGLELDHWWPVGDATAMRASVGVFRSLLPEEEDAAIVRETPERSGLGDLNFTARVTGFSDVGEYSTLQLGASARLIPRYEASDGVGTVSDLDDAVFGLDATYGWTDDTGEKRATVGGELLIATGDRVDSTLAPFDETVAGHYVFGDYAWSRLNSAGVQFSQVELADAGEPRLNELDVYYTRGLSEFQRLRFGVTWVDSDADPDSLRVAVQYTNFLGAHAHGVNW